MKFTDKLNTVVHPLFCKYIVYKYRRKIARYKYSNPHLFVPITPKVECKHKHIWSTLGIIPSLDWLRFYSNLNEYENEYYCPEDIFFSIIERRLVPCDRIGADAEDKNLLDYFIPKKYRADVLFRWMRGSFYDSNYNWVSKKYIVDILKNYEDDIVLKKCVNSSSGNGVYLFVKKKGRFFCDKKELDLEFISRLSESVIAESRILPDDFTSSFNPTSLNTCRIMALRCPWNGKICILNSMFRVGSSGSFVDNLGQSGLSLPLSEDGSLSAKGYTYRGDKLGLKIDKIHDMNKMQHPNYIKYISVVKECYGRFPYHNILSFDLATDKEGESKIIEINTRSQGVHGLQLGQGPVFQQLTEEVIDWCKKNENYSYFSHLRTFY